jgi:hypothetical protein
MKISCGDVIDGRGMCWGVMEDGQGTNIIWKEDRGLWDFMGVPPV